MEIYKGPEMENNPEEREGIKKPFIVLDYQNPENPIVLYQGTATSDEEAEAKIESETGININNKDIIIAFENGDNESNVVASEEDDSFEQAA